jgi:hypothetical protein
MSDSSFTNDWTAANQRLMVAELARLRQRLGDDGDASALSNAVADARAAMPAPAAIDVLADRFELSAFERDVLLLCAGAEMDGEIAERLAMAHSAASRGRVSFGLALATLDDPHWSAITPVRPLRRWRLVEVDDSSGLVHGALNIDERVLHYLAGVNYVDTRVRSFIRPAPPPSAMSNTHRALCDSVRAAIENARVGAVPPLIVLAGDDERGQVDLAAAVCDSLGLVPYVVRVEDLPSGQVELETFGTIWEREAQLSSAVLHVIAGADPLPRVVARMLESLGGLAFLGATQPPSLERAAFRVTVDKPSATEQRALWQLALGDASERLNGTLDGVAGQFRLSARTIHDAGVQLAPAMDDGARVADIMWGTCRSLARPKLDELAQRIEAVAGWDDLILHDTHMTALRQIVGQVRHRLRVYHDWGFSGAGARGLGISALFTGDSGTGKTMAAEVLARELRLDLYRIDLSAVVSKYIGESEKNLRRVFDAAEESGAVLLFDEADALFGKRSEVKDSHDRYANIEVSYLLQRMESYRGLAILTSNMRAALDVAFLRRLRFVVHFPFPDQELREAIWRRAFPERAPLGAIDFAKLARLNVAGGSIRNIALNAAFAAAAAGGPLTMAELLDAARRDAAKRERPLADVETRGWV